MKFAQNAFRSEKFSKWFVPDQKVRNTRSKPRRAKIVNTRTARFRKSALPYMTNLINKT